jgi:hypothetical protein
MNISNYMSWEAGVDLVALTPGNKQPDISEQPNIIVHVARMVHTPIGSAPSGLVLIQTDLTKPPSVMGYVCTDATIGAYYGPKIFAGTPFEHAPVLIASIEITESADSVGAIITIGETIIETKFTQLSPLEQINRAFGAPMPFTQQGLEASAAHASLKINGKEIEIALPPMGIAGGGAATWSPNGIYAR